MPSVLTGANLANRDLIYLGVSGDGDSASIGFGQFAHAHAPRRQHGLYRREQRRVRPDQGPVLRHRRPRLEVEARLHQHRQFDRSGRRWRCSSAPPSSPARFSGDKQQLVPIIKAAIEHKGAAFIDVISPCVAFNNHRRLDQELRLRARAQRGGEPARFHVGRVPIKVRIRAGHRRNGRAARRLEAARCASSTPTTRSTTARGAWASCSSTPPRARSSPACSTSARDAEDLHAHLSTVDAPLNTLGEKELCPGSAALDKFNASLR